MTSRHLFIAGTGRAGTSFLVRYLSALGLDTNLTRHGEAGWHEQAQAGLEDVPLPGHAADLPYVVKSPWLYEFIDEILTSPDLVLDAVIMPVRDLSEAATSRSVLELRAMHESTPWMAELDRSWESWGVTPGGVVYSVNPLDQARLLAVGFHKVVERLVKAEIPIIFLAFPRLTTDAAYLFRALKPVLPDHVSCESALAAHAVVADPGKVRVGPELEAAAKPRPILAYETHETVDRIALRREVVRLRALAHTTAEELATSKQESNRLRGLADATAEELAASEQESNRLRGLADAMAEELASSKHEADRLLALANRTAEELAASKQESDRLRALADTTAEELAAFRRETAYLRSAIDIIRNSSSWRITLPWRAIGGLLRRRHNQPSALTR